VGGARGLHGRVEKGVEDLVEKSEGKRPLGRPRRRWENAIKIDLTEGME
jgi:hypothetical protein